MLPIWQLFHFAHIWEFVYDECVQHLKTIQLLKSHLHLTSNTFHREETTGEIVKKLETEVFESNMDEDEMVEDEAEEEDMEANMEKAFEETVKKEVENNNREDKIMEK